MGRRNPGVMGRKLRSSGLVAGNLGVADHGGFLCWSCLPSVAQVALLPIGSTFVSYDLRGHGESPVPLVPYSLDELEPPQC
jgi:hypothetical protein